MTNFTQKFVTATATVAVLANAVMPLAFADTTITVSGNGSSSTSYANVTNSSTTNVTQTNYADIDNNVSGSASTGGNSANGNTGGAVNVTTGDASVSNTVANSANQNYANVSCACDNGDTLVKIAGNGTGSNNTAKLDNKNYVDVDQKNIADFDNHVWGEAKTGWNAANGNTGGSVSVTTGDASVDNSVSNWANGNSAVVGGGDGMGSTSLMILGNGSDSTSLVSLKMNNDVDLDQFNYADFDNHVGGKAKTGANSANDNTGGAVDITTGDASVDNSVDNMANFNSADLNCGCTVGDLEAKIEGNGTESNNTIKADFKNSQDLHQKNIADFDNHVWGDASTGWNAAVDNDGGAMDGDPSVTTGDAAVSSDVSSSANLNGLGGGMSEWPTWDFGGVHISLNFNLSALLAALGL
jgi:hypothetical protein